MSQPKIHLAVFSQSSHADLCSVWLWWLEVTFAVSALSCVFGLLAEAQDWTYLLLPVNNRNTNPVSLGLCGQWYECYCAHQILPFLSAFRLFRDKLWPRHPSSSLVQHGPLCMLKMWWDWLGHSGQACVSGLFPLLCTLTSALACPSSLFSPPREVNG